MGLGGLRESPALRAPTSTTSVSGMLRTQVLVRLLVSDVIDFTFRRP